MNNNYLTKSKDTDKYLLNFLEPTTIFKCAILSKSMNFLITKSYLYKKLFLYNRKNGTYKNILNWASENGYLEVVKYLIFLGADFRAKNDHAVILASSNGHLEVVKYLI